MKHEFKTARVAKSPPSSLRWWRDLTAGCFTSQHAFLLRIDLAQCNVPGEMGWCDARNGNAAAAIGIAIRVLRNRDSSDAKLDVAISAVLLATLNGDAAAREILMYAFRSQYRIVSDRIAESWRRAPLIEKAPSLPPPRRSKPRFFRPTRPRHNVGPVYSRC